MMIQLIHLEGIHLEGCFAFLFTLAAFLIGVWQARRHGPAESATIKYNREK